MKKYFLAGVLALLFFVVQLTTLSDYGMNWDNSSHFIRGQVYLNFFLTGKKTYDKALNFSPILIQPGEFMSRYAPAAIESAAKPAELSKRPMPQKDLHTFVMQEGRISFYTSSIWDGKYFITQQASGHPPLSDILSAISNRFFYSFLNIMGDNESYQLLYIFLSAVGIFIVTIFAYELSGLWIGGLVAGLSLGLFPLFFSDTHINLKDPAVAALFAGCIWSFWHLVQEGKKRWEIIFLTFFVFALGIKWNVVFLPFILLPWAFSIRKTLPYKKWLEKNFLIRLCSYIFFGILFLIFIWPYSWENPIKSILAVIQYYYQLGIGVHSIQPDGFILPLGINSYPLVLFLTQTPEIILLLACVGIVFFRGFKKREKLLLLLWLTIPLLRVTLPGFRLYGGLRQIMEVIPAIAVLAGIGGACLLRVIFNFQPTGLKQLTIFKKKIVRNVLSLSMIGVVYIVLFIPLVRIHPNENIYFNNFIGGIKGAYKANLVDWTLNYGNAYREAANWVNMHASKNANIAFLDGPMFALSPLWLRDDISISPNHFSGFEQKGEYILSLQNTLGSNTFAYRYPHRFLRPIHTISAGGVPILTIYKNDAQDSLSEIKEKQTTQFTGSPGDSNHGIYWEVDLGKRLKVTRIRITDINPSCQKTNDAFVHELIQFLPFADTQWSSNDVYASQEHNKVSSNTVEYLFAGEDAQYIRLYPKTGLSCINDARIESISYIEE